MSRLENKYRTKTMISDYAVQALSVLSRRFPEKSEEEIKGFIMGKVKGRKKFYIEADGGNWDFDKIDKVLLEEQPIFTGSGTFYRRHDQIHNDRAGMLIEFADKRSVEKKLKFKSQQENNEEEKDRHDNLQKSWKVMSNSYYGVQIEAHSQFYDNHSGIAITSTGVDAVQTICSFFEKFLYENIYFYDSSEAIQYVNYILNDNYDLDIKNVILDSVDLEKIANPENVTRHILRFILNSTKDDVNQVYQFIVRLTDEERIRIYYKNNLSAFFKDTKLVSSNMTPFLNNKEFLDPNTPTTDEMKNSLDEFASYLIEFVGFFHQDFNRNENLSNKKRKAVILSDTDSAFLYLGGLIRLTNKIIPEPVDESNTDAIIVLSNLLMYLVIQAATQALFIFFKENNVPDHQTYLLNMKSEFLSRKIMLTSEKKNYAHLILLNEGNKLRNPEMEVKGMAIKKVSANPKVRETVLPLIENEVLKSDKVDLKKILLSYKDLEKEIYSSLQSGELEYSVPASVKTADSYKDPFSTSQYKAMYIWNTMYPENPIVPPERVRTLKVNLSSWDDVTKNCEDPEVLERFKRVFEDSNIAGKAITSIALATDLTRIPDELIPFVDASLMVSNLMKSGKQLLTSVGIESLTSTDMSLPTNIINI